MRGNLLCVYCACIVCGTLVQTLGEVYVPDTHLDLIVVCSDLIGHVYMYNIMQMLCVNINSYVYRFRSPLTSSSGALVVAMGTYSFCKHSSFPTHTHSIVMLQPPDQLTMASISTLVFEVLN